MTVCDDHAGCTYLVKYGADFFVLSASATDKKSPPLNDRLMAAKGFLIRVCGKRIVTLRINPRCSFTQEFPITDVPETILGANFFIANDLATDMSRMRLIAMADLATRSTRQSSSVTGIHMPSVNAADHIIAEFPQLVIPHFKFTWPPTTCMRPSLRYK